MGKLIRFGISVDSELLERFDARNRKKEYHNRSEAIRDLIRECLVAEEWKANKGEMVGVVSLVYDHRKMELPKNLTDAQHKKHTLVVSTLHVHLDPHNCLDVLVLRGMGREVRKLADSLMSRRGVKHGKLSLTTLGRKLV